MSTKNDASFQEAMADVSPLKRADDKIAVKPRRDPLVEAARRLAATARTGDPNPLTLPDNLARIGPHDIVGLKKDGVQEGVFRKLRLGKYEIQSRLDLHRLTVREARGQVYRFLNEASNHGLRTLLVTHGKGNHSPEPGTLKSFVMHWLEESDLVMAYHSAQPPHGGAGATYVLIRKSAEQRQRTREIFRRGRV